MDNSKTILLYGKRFREIIPYEKIKMAVEKVAERINLDYKGKDTPVFLGVLNGSFMFMSELLRKIDFNCEVSFVKIASYQGTTSSGHVTELIGLTDNIKGRHVIIVEDIVDTGNSIEHMLELLEKHEPASVSVATLLLKPDSYKKERPVEYYALSIPDKFIVGFGLDYDQLGRNLDSIYEIEE